MTAMADDRNTLSALFDGELDDDAARFATRRLGHDVEWRRSVERWQLVGDVLRGQASKMAPAGFSERVAAAIARPASEHVAAPAVAVAAAPVEPVHPSVQRPAVRRARLWSGMALAASLAGVAALLAPSMRSEMEPSPQVVAAPVAAPPSVETTAMVADTTQGAAAPVRPVVRRARSNTSRVARAVRSRESTVQPAAPSTRLATRPFQPPLDDTITTRPWPRATLPGLQAGGAFTASYSEAEGPSFYPFEPDANRQPAAPAPSP